MGRWANKYVIGLTGNIAMGKSLVRKMLENLGAYTIDADGLAHQAMAPGAPAYGPIIETFGKWILDGDNKIDRSKLGAVAFAHNDALNRLEQITHPVVGQAIDILISRAKQPVVVVEAIKLVDGALGSQVDTVWVVDATPETQLQRLLSRRGMTEWEAHKRIETQNPQAEKLAKANVVISNNGTPETVWATVQREFAKIGAAGKRATGEVRTVTVSPEAQARDQQQARQQAAAPAPSQAPTQQPAEQQAPVQRPPAQQPSSKPLVQPLPNATPTPTQQPAASQAAPALPISKVDIRRGMPKNAEVIARLLNQASGKQVSREDVILAFGEKSYLLAEANGRVIGLAGFQVENLITRMDEFYIVPEAPLAAVAEALIKEVEEASKELQSEVGFIFVPRTTQPGMLQAFLDQGYERIEIDGLKVPAWREAAQESYSPEKLILMKKLRAERVLKPV